LLYTYISGKKEKLFLCQTKCHNVPENLYCSKIGGDAGQENTYTKAWDFLLIGKKDKNFGRKDQQLESFIFC
jgi:hypothetical protein